MLGLLHFNFDESKYALDKILPVLFCAKFIYLKIIF